MQKLRLVNNLEKRRGERMESENEDYESQNRNNEEKKINKKRSDSANDYKEELKVIFNNCSIKFNFLN